MTDTAAPGQALRAIRLSNGWTLAEVSARTGLPLSMISKIELGKVSPNYEKLARICTGLGIDIGSLFSASSQSPEFASSISGRRTITRAGEGQLIETDVYSHLYAAADLLNKRFVPVIAEIRARSLEEFGGLIKHSGEEYAYVLKGSLELHTELYAPVLLNEGDSIYFDSGMAHAYIAVGDDECRILSICSGAETQLQRAYGHIKPAEKRTPAKVTSLPKPKRAKSVKSA